MLIVIMLNVIFWGMLIVIMLIVIMLNIIMLSFWIMLGLYADCHYAECRLFGNADCPYVDCHYPECRNAVFLGNGVGLYVNCHYPECPYAECRGTFRQTIILMACSFIASKFFVVIRWSGESGSTNSSLPIK